MSVRIKAIILHIRKEVSCFEATLANNAMIFVASSDELLKLSPAGREGVKTILQLGEVNL